MQNTPKWLNYSFCVHMENGGGIICINFWFHYLDKITVWFFSFLCCVSGGFYLLRCHYVPCVIKKNVPLETRERTSCEKTSQLIPTFGDTVYCVNV